MEIIPFDYKSKSVRVIQDENGDLWWVAKDVCTILGLEDTHKAVQRLEEDEKGRKIIPTPGGEQEMLVINEPGLYSLMLRSNKPEAKQFKKWVTHEVLPTIRKTGKYEIQGISELDLIIRSAQALKNIETRVHTLEAKTHKNSGETGYWTITAWCKLNNLKISLDEAMQRGREATQLSKEWKAGIGKVQDERYGIVNSYREDVLEDVFGIEGAAE
jgi:prophage antirepressor-like protein